MSLPASDLKDLQAAVADRLYLQINAWHLYLGDAGLAEALAVECSALVNQSSAVAAMQAIEAVKVPVAAWSRSLAATRVTPPAPPRASVDTLQAPSAPSHSPTPF